MHPLPANAGHSRKSCLRNELTLHLGFDFLNDRFKVHGWRLWAICFPLSIYVSRLLTQLTLCSILPANVRVESHKRTLGIIMQPPKDDVARRARDMDKPLPKLAKGKWSLKNLNLDLNAAKEGKTWLLLPEGYRDSEYGLTYPLPSNRRDLQILSSIVIPEHKGDSGCKYLRRAVEEWKRQQRKQLSALLDVDHRNHQIHQAQYQYTAKLKKLTAEARKAANEVREEAKRQVASLSTLFDLTKKGLEGMIQAYLDNKEWHGEKVRNSEFLAAGRIVTQTSKAFGLPPKASDNMTQALMDEYAASVKGTKEVVALAPSDDPDEVEH